MLEGDSRGLFAKAVDAVTSKLPKSTAREAKNAVDDSEAARQEEFKIKATPQEAPLPDAGALESNIDDDDADRKKAA
ncbi:MAG: hypothetical protein COX81_03975 [Candidatus Magasanikbacteria bacterium CG_4_10_14_0_2_um_filter_37_12]|uniref:Uncharacterized protein n=1 Tax=Candidatus Magasanikbacteria bacterium CG_4_10_14_0_2_um_filter_37_12 TaxID=1974637 RepID=A0A2M7V6E9_9BACT|nr:MAG: hypothetical protein COX81_03975 [Candidatus Magasanikbacteria bacterium CG_4_10_14_0_2_um_filter_37_12]